MDVLMARHITELFSGSMSCYEQQASHACSLRRCGRRRETASAELVIQAEQRAKMRAVSSDCDCFRTTP
ncbi:hypothetical protein CBOM_07478 [Ceraceosorus bombacis]|uniref:Uncharacterized protein n=1 Tax=Ceraceosorus bombacis TaxID=401625 RepID=A0A0N7L8X5_9BASI|nr:hypothetical protein CBOM_07478 [Ceraceosorus bombacis]